MKPWIVGVAVTVMFGMVTAQEPVTIRGCVVAGTEPDTYILTRVTEIPAGQVREQPVPTDSQGRDVLYWLNTTKGLKKEIGQRVEVRGTIDPNNPKEGTTKITEDPSKRLDTTNTISSGGKSVEAKTDTQPTTTTEVKTRDKEKDRVVYRLKVISLRRVDGACR